MINQSFSCSPQCERDFRRRMYVRIGSQKCAADEVVGMGGGGHPGFPGNQNILSKYGLSAVMTEMNQSFVSPETGPRDPFERVQTWLTVPAVSRISSMHCCPSTSTCCERENKGQKMWRLISGQWLRQHPYVGYKQLRQDIWSGIMETLMVQTTPT